MISCAVHPFSESTRGNLPIVPRSAIWRLPNCRLFFLCDPPHAGLHQHGIGFALINGKRGTGVSRYAPQTRI